MNLTYVDVVFISVRIKIWRWLNEKVLLCL